jgi:flagellar FliL protein
MAEKPAEKAAAKEGAEEGAEAKPKGGKKGLIIAIAAVVVLAGGGFAAFKMLGHKPEEKGAKAKEEKGEVLPALYITLDPPFVVNFQAAEAVRFLQITIGLMTRDPETEKLVKENDPRVRNDLLLILGNQSYATVSTTEGKEELRKRSLEAVRAVVKDSGGEGEKLEALYFTSFVMQ